MNKEELAQRTFDILEATGLNWTVKQEPLVSSIGGKATDAQGLFMNGSDKYLATVGPQYGVYQNHEMAEALVEATESVGLSLTGGGMLKGGKRVYLQAELPEEYIGKSGMRRHITGTNTHDGTHSIGFGSSGTVIVCENTWYKAYGELSKFKHTSTAKERILTFIQGMKQVLSLDGKLIETFKIMADTTVEELLVKNVLNKVFEIEIDKSVQSLSSREQTKINSVKDVLETEFKLQGPTVWGLFNAVTRYTNHVATVKKGVQATPERKAEYLMMGEGYEKNLKAYKTIREWLEEHKLVEPELVLV